MSLKQKLENSPGSQREQKQLKGGGGGKGGEGEDSFASLSNKMDVMFNGIRSLLENQGKTLNEKVVKLSEGQEAMRNEINDVKGMMMTKAGVVDVVKEVVKEELSKLKATVPDIDKGRGVIKSKSVGARPRDENEDACTVAIGNFEYNSFRDEVIKHSEELFGKIEDIEGAGKYYTLDRRCSVCFLAFKELESKIAFLKNQEDKGPFYHNDRKLFLGTKETPEDLRKNRAVGKLKKALYKMAEEGSQDNLKRDFGDKASGKYLDAFYRRGTVIIGKTRVAVWHRLEEQLKIDTDAVNNLGLGFSAEDLVQTWRLEMGE